MPCTLRCADLRCAGQRQRHQQQQRAKSHAQAVVWLAWALLAARRSPLLPPLLILLLIPFLPLSSLAACLHACPPSNHAALPAGRVTRETAAWMTPPDQPETGGGEVCHEWAARARRSTAGRLAGMAWPGTTEASALAASTSLQWLASRPASPTACSVSVHHSSLLLARVL